MPFYSTFSRNISVSNLANAEDIEQLNERIVDEENNNNNDNNNMTTKIKIKNTIKNKIKTIKKNAKLIYEKSGLEHFVEKCSICIRGNDHLDSGEIERLNEHFDNDIREINENKSNLNRFIV